MRQRCNVSNEWYTFICINNNYLNLSDTVLIHPSFGLALENHLITLRKLIRVLIKYKTQGFCDIRYTKTHIYLYLISAFSTYLFSYLHVAQTVQIKIWGSKEDLKWITDSLKFSEQMFGCINSTSNQYSCNCHWKVCQQENYIQNNHHIYKILVSFRNTILVLSYRISSYNAIQYPFSWISKSNDDGGVKNNKNKAW